MAGSAAGSGSTAHPGATRAPLLLAPRAAAAGREELTAVIQEAYVLGISTRWSTTWSRRSASTSNSKSQGSRTKNKIDGRVKAFLDQPLEGD